MDVTERVAAFALELQPRDLPEGVRGIARAAILDTLACAIGGRDEAVARILREEVVAEGARPAASIWGSRVRSSPARAALVNGASAHALDFDDVNWALQGHPSVPLLPAVLASAEVSGASGEATLLAFVVGFEVEARLGQALGRGHYERGWHPTATLGAIGASVAAGRLLGLDAGALRRAIGIACSRVAGSRMNFGTDTKPLHAGLAAETGVWAASLALRGLTAREDGLEADMGLADLYHGIRPLELPPLGRPFALEDPGLELKPYPCCRFTHRIIDAVLALRDRNPECELAALECEVDPFAQKILIYPGPRTGLEAKFSLPYCAAISWLDGPPQLRAFSDSNLARPELRSLLGRVSVRDSNDACERATAVFADGARDSETVRHARGTPAAPLSDAERIHKARGLLEPVLGAAKSEALIAAVEGLDGLPRLDELIALLAPPGDD